LLAFLAGWITGVLAIAVLLLIEAGGVFVGEEPAVVRLFVWSAWMTALLFVVWIVALFPLYLLVPRSSALWRPQVCGSFGALAGVLIIWLVFRAPLSDAFFLYVAAAFVGGVTCLLLARVRDPFGSPTI